MNGHTRRIALMTDSTADLPRDLIAKYDITIVPLYVIWGEEELKDGVDIDNETFYARLPVDPVHPRTSQPTPGDFVTAIEELDAEEVLIITISDQLSGTFDSANTARELSGKPVHVVDSYSVSMGLGWQVLAAARAREAGGDIEAMIAAAQRVREQLSVLFTVDTLDYLHKGGRIGGAAKLLGTALQLKPMLEVDPSNGFVDAVERTRTRQKAVQRIMEASFERVDTTRPMRICIMHAAAADGAQDLYEKVTSKYNPVEAVITELTPVLGVHVGPGTLGIIVCND